MKSGKFWIVFSNFILIIFFSLAGVSSACVDIEPESSLYIGTFRPDLSELAGREPAYFYPDSVLSPWTADTEAENIDDWIKRIPTATRKDVAAFVYDAPLEKLKALRLRVVLNKNQTGGSNTVEKYILTQKDIPLLDYLIYVRECASMGHGDDSWDYRPPDAKAAQTLLIKAENGVITAKDPFLKERYNYQKLRIMFSMGDYEDVVRIFETGSAGIRERSPLFTWFRSLYAGALFRQREYARAYIEFARVFQASSRYRADALLGARWALQAGGKAVLDEALNRVTDVQDKSRILALTAYLEYDFCPELLDSIAVQTPHLRDLEVLMVREINKLELHLRPLSVLDWFSYVPVSADSSSVRAWDTLGKLRKTAVSLRKQSSSSSFWETVTAYLEYLKGDFPAARAAIARAVGMEKTEKVTEQLGILSLLIDARTVKLDSMGEAHLLRGLAPLAKRIEAVARDDRNHFPIVYFDRVFAHITAHILAPRYAREGYIEKEVVLYSLPQRLTAYIYIGPEATEYGSAFRRMEDATPAQMERIRHFVLTPPTAYDRFIVRNFPYKEGKLLEIEAVRRIYYHDFTGAVKTLQELDSVTVGHMEKDDKQVSLLKGEVVAFKEPFQVYRLGETIPVPQSERSLLDGIQGAAGFAARMAAFEHRAHNPHTDADYSVAYLYAIGLYNIGSLGNSWRYAAYENHPSCYRTVPKHRPESDFYQGTEAQRVFARVGKEASDPELRARALFMAALTLQQQREWFYEGGKPKGSYFSDNPYFRMLKDSYASTQFYKAASRQCSYLRDFR